MVRSGLGWGGYMFPARAGMSRRTDNLNQAHGHVPRASGDEPTLGAGTTR